MLTAEQIAQFHRDGFLIIRGVFKGKELAALQKASDMVVAEALAGKGEQHYYHTRPGGEKIYFRSERMWTRDPIFKAVTVNPALLEAVGQCFGHPFLPFNDSFVCKVPRGDVPIGWHQDPPYGKPYVNMKEGKKESCPIPNFDTDIYLDRSDIANGCVWGIPGHHLVGHVDLENFTQEELFEQFGAVPMEMDPGDVLFHTISGPHGSIGNKTDTIRRIFYVNYLPQETYDIEYAGYAWAKDKNPGLAENRKTIATMVEVREQLGYGGLDGSRVRWTEEGFEFVGEPTTPKYHWRTLIAAMPEAEKERLRRLEKPIAAGSR